MATGILLLVPKTCHLLSSLAGCILVTSESIVRMIYVWVYVCLVAVFSKFKKASYEAFFASLAECCRKIIFVINLVRLFGR